MITDFNTFQTLALPYIKEYARKNRQFVTADARRWAYDNGLEEAKHGGWWGAVATTAVEKNLIKRVRSQERAKHRGTFITVWESLVYGYNKESV